MASIHKTPAGTWKVRMRVAGIGPSRTFKRKADASAFAAEMTLLERTGGRYTATTDKRVTVAEWAEEWRARQVHWKPATRAAHLTWLRPVVDVIGDRPLASITEDDMVNVVTVLTQSYAPRTVKEQWKKTRALFAAAVKAKRLAESPCTDAIKLPPIEPSFEDPLSTEVVHLVAQAMPARHRAPVLTAAGTGLRWGELFGLTLDRLFIPDDDLTVVPLDRDRRPREATGAGHTRRVRVDRQLVGLQRCSCAADGCPGWAPVFGPPKSKASYREVPLADGLIAALVEHLAMFPPGPHGLVFTRDNGTPWTSPAWSNLWAPTARLVGFEPGEGLHKLRHYYASLLIRQRCTPKEVQRRLGHASAKETLDTYTHLWPDDDAVTARAVDDVLFTPRVLFVSDSSASGT